MLEVVLFDQGNTLIYFDSTWPEVIAQSDQALYSFLIQSGYKLDEAFPRIYALRMDRYYQEMQPEFIILPKAAIGALSELPGLLKAWGNQSGLQ